MTLSLGRKLTDFILSIPFVGESKGIIFFENYHPKDRCNILQAGEGIVNLNWA